MSNQTVCCPETRDAKPASSSRASGALWSRYGNTGAGSVVEDQLVTMYLPLVKSIVGRMAMSLPSHIDVQDLYSAALTGLLTSVRRYRPENGVAFETYSRVRIRGAIFDELRRLDWVPRSVHEKARKVNRVMQELEQAKGGVPTEAEMARAMKLTISEYRKLLNEIRPTTFVCVDTAARGESDEGHSVAETLSDQNQPDPSEETAKRELARLVTERLDELPEAQRKVLALYYFEGLRLREIAEVFGVTESRICQIHSQAILSLKSFLSKRGCLAT